MIWSRHTNSVERISNFKRLEFTTKAVPPKYMQISLRNAKLVENLKAHPLLANSRNKIFTLPYFY